MSKLYFTILPILVAVVVNVVDKVAEVVIEEEVNKGEVDVVVKKVENKTDVVVPEVVGEDVVEDNKAIKVCGEDEADGGVDAVIGNVAAKTN